MWALVGSDGMLEAQAPGGLLRMRAALGRGGIRADKREGDGATPVGRLALRQVLFRADRGVMPHCAVPRRPLGPADGWCDDPADAAYNRMVRLPHDGRHEALWRDDAVYDVIGVLGWNDAPVVRGLGSAIFLHVAQAGYEPTEGCVALAVGDLMALLAAGLAGIEVRQAALA